MRRLISLILLLTAISASAQTDSIPAAAAPAAAVKSTPVDIDDAKPRVVMHYYDKHGQPLDEPVMFLAALDTVQAPKSKPLYPLYNGVSIGVDFGDALFLAFGQRYANFGITANCSLFNWFFPTVEAGVGFANEVKNSKHYAFTVKPSFYVKAGFNYNFLYKSSPDYKAYLGLRAGMSSFRYDVFDTRPVSSEDAQTMQPLRGLRATCWYGDIVAGVEVKIVGCFSLGWSARYTYVFKKPKPHGFAPLFIPGAPANTPFSFTLTAAFSI